MNHIIWFIWYAFMQYHTCFESDFWWRSRDLSIVETCEMTWRLWILSWIMMKLFHWNTHFYEYKWLYFKNDRTTDFQLCSRFVIPHSVWYSLWTTGLNEIVHASSCVMDGLLWTSSRLVRVNQKQLTEKWQFYLTFIKSHHHSAFYCNNFLHQ